MSWSILSGVTGQGESLGGLYNGSGNSQSVQLLSFSNGEFALETIGQAIVLLALILYLADLGSKLLLGFLHSLAQTVDFRRQTFGHLVAELQIFKPGDGMLGDMALEMLQVSRHDRGLWPVGHCRTATPKGRSYVMSRAEVGT